MKNILVTASKSYSVFIGNGLLKEAGKYISQIKRNATVAVISDSHVFPIYGNTLLTSLKDAGFSAISFVFPAGEDSKTPGTYLQILNFLAENQLTRSDLIIALGGGVTGDMAGFAAATYLRGISFVQIPTSLLAMVDSSVGGKTAIDLPAGKNLVGAFYQPDLVLCDMDTLDTLPPDVFLDGCAEVIKYAVLYDAYLFETLLIHGPAFPREDVIARCVSLKRDVVAEDEHDNGARQKLNLGHTIGHGIEGCSNFSISHGKAVAIGMNIVAKAGNQIGITTGHTKEQIENILHRFGLPTASPYPAKQLYSFALSDKKRSANWINLIIPETIGSCIIRKTPIHQLESFIQAGL